MLKLNFVVILHEVSVVSKYLILVKVKMYRIVFIYMCVCTYIESEVSSLWCGWFIENIILAKMSNVKET